MAAPLRIGDLLKVKGLITENQMGIALAQQKVTGELLGHTITKLGFVSSSELTKTLAEQAGMEYMDIAEYAIPESALKMISKDIAHSSGFVPLDVDNGKLHIGISNPTNISAVDVVTRLTKIPPKVYMVDSEVLTDVLDRAYFFLENPIQKQIGNIVNNIKSTGQASGESVTKLTDSIIMDAIRRNTTDIHINPGETVIQVTYRVDGVLQHGHCLPKASQTGIISRLKILSKLDIAETRLPQDGAFNYTALKKSFDMRISTVPSIYGENVVIRILPSAATLPSIGELGFSSDDVQKIKTFFSKPYGVILIVGPTGSGKTTTLYAALREVNILEKNVLTVEDPVEYKLSFVKQTQINEKTGYDFALAGRNFMRQDPDVMLLGEIRDEETAKISIRSSMTGHLVLSTLHANDTISAIPRLLDLNIGKFLLSTSLLAIIAQRLVRKICRFCKTEYELDKEGANIFKEFGMQVEKAFKGKGCSKCGGIGYAGRTVIGEVLEVDGDIKELIYTSASVNLLKTRARENGMVLFKEDALKKASIGITTLEEVLRVTV